MAGETYEVVRPKKQQRSDIIHDIQALISRYFTTRTHYKDCVLIEFFSDPLREEHISGWRVDKQFYKKDIEKFFTHDIPKPELENKRRKK